MSNNQSSFVSLNIAILTISDTRTFETDTSGDALKGCVESSGHKMEQRAICTDDTYEMRAIISAWIADTKVDVIVTTGGTGFTGRDSTPEALAPLFDKQIEGFGELFRQISYQDIGTSTVQSRCLAGIANHTVIFCLPGSTNACKTGWDNILAEQLDASHRPCNFVQHTNATKR